MDDLLREFLTETSESLDTVDNQLVKFEQDPSDAKKSCPRPRSQHSSDWHPPLVKEGASK